MRILVATTVVFGLLALFFLGRTVRCARHGRPLRAAGSCMSGLTSVAIAARTVHALTDPPGIDVWSVARRFPVFLPGVDAYYGTATYVPMLEGARYEISLTRDALIARPGNAAAQQAVGNWGTR